MAVKFDGLKAVVPTLFASSWGELRDGLATHRQGVNKTDGGLWSPVTYYEGARRGVRGVRFVEALVVDLDGESLDGARLDGLEFFAYSTWSHSFESPHFHLVLPLAEAVPASLWRAVWVELHERLGVVGDPSTKDASRIFFLPQHPFCAGFEFREGRGRFLDADFSFEVDPQRLKFRPSSPVRGVRAGVEMLSEDWWCERIPKPWWADLPDDEKYAAMLARWEELSGVV